MVGGRGTVGGIVVGVSLPILLTACSVYQSRPSGPVVIRNTPRCAIGSGYSVMSPAVVILPILFPIFSVNQRLPSGPLVMAPG